MRGRIWSICTRNRCWCGCRANGSSIFDNMMTVHMGQTHVPEMARAVQQTLKLSGQPQASWVSLPAWLAKKITGRRCNFKRRILVG
jgi:hypothetical protein